MWDKTQKLIEEIIVVHSKSDSNHQNETTQMEQEVLENMKTLIAQGETQLYPLYALFSASNNWNTLKIVRNSEYEYILTEAINKGALPHDDLISWNYILLAAERNEPSEFFRDMEFYYNFLMDAAENGNSVALDLALTIWPPENDMDED
ncbi:MAG: hypothetical protein IKY60_01840 [Bacteroidales bacterium]|nr:hypothetical protein [Bacteroidales bacterium]